MSEPTSSFEFLHGPITLDGIEPDNPSDLQVRQDSPAHEVRDRSDIASVMLCHLAFVFPWAQRGRAPRSTDFVRSCQLSPTAFSECLAKPDNFGVQSHRLSAQENLTENLANFSSEQRRTWRDSILLFILLTGFPEFHMFTRA